MTVIVYRDGAMAADSAVWCDNIVVGHTRKVHRIGNYLFGAAGSSKDVAAYRVWIEQGGMDYPNLYAAPAVDDDPDHALHGLIVGPDPNTIFRISGARVYDISGIGQYHVCGAHNEFLLGALTSGASAQEAVYRALKYCAFARGEVQVVRLTP